MADILHRDVSVGNILINANKGAKEGDRGILIDLDHAVRLEKLEMGMKTVVCNFRLFSRGCIVHSMVVGYPKVHVA